MDKQVVIPWIDKKWEKLNEIIKYPDKLEEQTPIYQFSEGRINCNQYKNKFYKFSDYEYPEINFNKKDIDYELSKKKLIESYNKSKTKIETNKDLDQKKKDIKLKTLLTKHTKKVDNNNKIVKTFTYKVNFNEEQIKKIFVWINECIDVYKECVNIFNNHKDLYTSLYTKFKLVVFKRLFKDKNKEKNAPYDTLTDIVREFCSNTKSAFTNLKNGNITHFEMKVKQFKTAFSLFISKKSINKDGIFTSLLGKQKEFSKIIDVSEIENDCRLIYDKQKKEFYLKCPMYEKLKTIKNRESVCGLDPGEKIFMTFYGTNTCGTIGEDIRKPILRMRNKISKLQSILKKGVNRKNKKLRNKNYIKRKISKTYEKIKNIVKELHNKTALFLCKNFEQIIIPPFETQKMVADKRNEYKNKAKIERQNINGENKNEVKNKLKAYTRKGRLNKRVKYVLNTLSHYKFRQHLLNKCEEYGCELSVKTEEYTSKLCSKCGKISDKYNNREKECEHCEYKINRDINGARNILVKNMKDKVTIKTEDKIKRKTKVKVESRKGITIPPKGKNLGKSN